MTTLGTSTSILLAQGVAAAAIGASVGQPTFAMSFADYGMASLFACIGIVTRHVHEMSKTRTFDGKGMAFDLPTAPFLGIVAFVGAKYMQFADYVDPLIIMMVGFLGPEWIRQLAEGLQKIILTKLGGGKGG